MHITKVDMENWVCFAGENTVNLEPKAYAVVGARTGKDGSSNWAGKTSFVEAIRFALYGVHRHRTEDEWITRGEDSGSVSVTFDEGSVVTRARKRGKRTELKMTKGSCLYMGQDAQDEMACVFGADLATFNSTSFFEQKHMARLINSSTEERMRAVTSWIDMSLVEQGEEVTRARYKNHVVACDQLQGTLTSLFNQLERLGESYLDDFHSAALKDERSTLQALVKFTYDTKAEHTTKRALKQSLAERVDRIKADGAALKKHLELTDGGALDEVPGDIEKLTDKVAVLKNAYDEATKLRTHGFNGECPLANAPCPSSAFVQSRAAESKAVQDDIYERLYPLKKKLDECQRVLKANKEKADARARSESQLSTLRSEYVKALEAYEAMQVPDPVSDDTDAQITNSNARIQEINDVLSSGTHTKSQKEALVLDQEKATKALEEAILERNAFAVALEILGKNGLQRVLAERTMAAIAYEASSILKSAGIDLGLDISWAREGSGKASSCNACGAAFPTSLKVVKCESCGAARGANMIQKVEFILSDRSGAAEDLAGIALQLAAAKHMKTTRGLSLDFCILDEPFGALDAHNRAGFSKALPSILAQAGMRQSFIIAHSPDVMEFLPGRIEILAGNEGSSLKVVG